jgi:iron complex transport system substrate-binding protein
MAERAFAGRGAARQLVPALTGPLVLWLAACGVGGPPPVEGVESPSAAVDDRRVVALGEEFLLADLLALDVPVVATTVTAPAAGIQGLDGLPTEDVLVLESTGSALETVVDLDPTLLVASDFVVGELGRDRLEAIAPLVVVGEGPWRTVFAELGGALGRAAEAAEALDGYDADVEAARSALGTAPTVSVATVYPGESIAVWAAGPSTVPAVLEDLEVPLRPGTEDLRLDEQGRAFVSLEEVPELLDGEQLLLLQSGAVEGEQESLDATLAGPVFGALPAVVAGEVSVLDRLGYPGLPGRLQAVEDVVEAIGG